jgi:hypothetical protein
VNRLGILVRRVRLAAEGDAEMAGRLLGLFLSRIEDQEIDALYAEAHLLTRQDRLICLHGWQAAGLLFVRPLLEAKDRGEKWIPNSAEELTMMEERWSRFTTWVEGLSQSLG